MLYLNPFAGTDSALPPEDRSPRNVGVIPPPRLPRADSPSAARDWANGKDSAASGAATPVWIAFDEHVYIKCMC